ncbi:MAG: PP2C family protein-serine/threonine phosphatase [Planctomycetota bacterium]
MARKSSRSTGKLATRFAVAFGAACLLTGLAAALVVLGNLSSAIAPKDDDILKKGQIAAIVLPLVLGVIGALVGRVLAAKVGSRLTDLGLAVSKLGRGGTEVRVRVSGDDEVAALGRSLQYLANDLSELLAAQEKSGGALVTMDPQVRQLRDKALPQTLAGMEGFEIDGALSAGSRGGLDYYDAVVVGDSLVLYLISGEGSACLSVLAARMARDEVHRALAQGALPRKALSHANRVMKQSLPPGVCAKATLVQLTAQGAKLYQAGARAPMLICQRGEVREQAAEGLALGLDDGPVFDKALRPQEVPMSPGTRVLLVNEAALRTDEFRDRIAQHSPRHTAMFMNMVLGGVEEDAGDDGLREDVVLLTAKRTGAS